jgi:hypothetical protein
LTKFGVREKKSVFFFTIPIGAELMRRDVVALVSAYNYFYFFCPIEKPIKNEQWD